MDNAHKCDFTCLHMMIPSNMHGIVGCIRQIFGPFPSLATCAKECRGNPDALVAAKEQRAKIAAMPRCEFLELETGACIDPELTIDQCVQLDGTTCRHFVAKQAPCKACGDKGA